MVGTRHHQQGYSQAPPPARRTSAAVAAVRRGGRPVIEESDNDSSEEDEQANVGGTQGFTQRTPPGQQPSDEEEEEDDPNEVIIESASGSMEYVNAMFSGNPLPSQYTAQTLLSAGIKTEAQTELWHARAMEENERAAASQSSHATNPPVASTPVRQSGGSLVDAAPSQQRDTPRPTSQAPRVVNPYTTGRRPRTNTTQIAADPAPLVAAAPAPPVDPARAIHQDLLGSGGNGFELMDLDLDQLATIDDCQRGGNTPEYMARQEALEQRFFLTVELYGGIALKPLLVMV